jgi:hypothetical protein
LATDALVKRLGHVVLDEFLDQVAQMSLAEDDVVDQYFAPRRNPSTGSVRLRATCFIHASPGSMAIPAISYLVKAGSARSTAQLGLARTEQRRAEQRRRFHGLLQALEL